MSAERVMAQMRFRAGISVDRVLDWFEGKPLPEDDDGNTPWGDYFPDLVTMRKEGREWLLEWPTEHTQVVVEEFENGADILYDGWKVEGLRSALADVQTCERMAERIKETAR